MFYEFSQNNSGGYFDVDDKVCHKLFIESDSKDEAIDKAEKLGCYWDGVLNGMDCDCCGDRWSGYTNAVDLDKYKAEGYKVGIYDHYKNPEERWNKLYGHLKILKQPKWEERYSFREYVGKILFNSIEEYAQYLADEFGQTVPDARIFYKDGTVKEIFQRNIG